MAKLIETDTRLEAWMQAADHLLVHGPVLNLILAVGSPATGGIDVVINKFLKDENQFPMHTVAETVLPAYEYRHRGLAGVLDYYPNKVYPAIKKHPSNSWGTYAYRLVRRPNANDEPINPLKQMIDKMKSEIKKPRTMRSCYEIGVAAGEYEMSLYSPVRDGTRRRGGPCLSHLSFKLFRDAVHLTALYRSHDYSYKVPGNLLGLARLQGCVAREVDRGIGSLVVHSSYAFLGSSKGAVRELLKRLHQNAAREDSRNEMAH